MVSSAAPGLTFTETATGRTGFIGSSDEYDLLISQNDGGEIHITNTAGTLSLGGTSMSFTGGFAVWGTTPPSYKPTITGSRSGATATVLEAVLQALQGAGLLTDSTTS